MYKFLKLSYNRPNSFEGCEQTIFSQIIIAKNTNFKIFIFNSNNSFILDHKQSVI